MNVNQSWLEFDFTLDARGGGHVGGCRTRVRQVAALCRAHLVAASFDRRPRGPSCGVRTFWSESRNRDVDVGDRRFGSLVDHPHGKVACPDRRPLGVDQRHANPGLDVSTGSHWLRGWRELDGAQRRWRRRILVGNEISTPDGFEEIREDVFCPRPKPEMSGAVTAKLAVNQGEGERVLESPPAPFESGRRGHVVHQLRLFLRKEVEPPKEAMMPEVTSHYPTSPNSRAAGHSLPPLSLSLDKTYFVAGGHLLTLTSVGRRSPPPKSIGISLAETNVDAPEELRINRIDLQAGDAGDTGDGLTVAPEGDALAPASQRHFFPI